MRDKNGHFAPGNTFAAGYGAPVGNQNAKGHGPPARNINALRYGFYLHFKEGEAPENRLPRGADVLFLLKEIKKVQEHWAKFQAIAERGGIRGAKCLY